MYLLEHDGKELLARGGIAVPPGVLIEQSAHLAVPPLPAGPWVVKAQVPVGGRGKAGAIKLASSQEEVRKHLDAILGMRVKGFPVHACRVEGQVGNATETYLSFAIDAQAGGVRILIAARGGMEIEAMAQQPGVVRTAVVAPDAAALAQGVRTLVADAPDPQRGALIDAGARLGRVFLERECSLLEINPLFVHVDGSWIAGDAKIITDDNALYRQAGLVTLLKARARAYPEVALKWEYGCDYVVVDPEGDLGLLTTGAGLSMMLIDELRAAGMRPYNFLDVRTGGLRGDPTRLIHVLNWIADGPNIKAVLVNVFAGITHLGEFSRLLVEALNRSPRLKVPVVTRLVGNGLDDARQILAQAGIAVEPDLAKAVAMVRENLAGGAR